jgi:hypothetical protein
MQKYLCAEIVILLMDKEINNWRHLRRTNKPRLTPTQVIEQSSDNRERAWIKAPRELPRRVSRSVDEREDEVAFSANPNRNETVIHTHVKLDRAMERMPSPIDVHALRQKNGHRAEIVAEKQQGKVAGYAVVMRIPNGPNSSGKKNHFLRTQNSLGMSNAIRKEVKRFRQLGLSTRFVPNKKAGFVFQGGKFVKGPIAQIRKK